MKLSLIALGMFALVGCASRQLPPQNSYGITETSRQCDASGCSIVTKSEHGTVTVRQLPPTKVMGEIISVVPSAPFESDNPYETEEDRIAAEEEKARAAQALHDAIEKAVKKDACKCISGDPLCSCL